MSYLIKYHAATAMRQLQTLTFCGETDQKTSVLNRTISRNLGKYVTEGQIWVKIAHV